MTGFFSKLFGSETQPESISGVQERTSNSDRQRRRREPLVEIDWSQAEYIPLPPSPPTWEVDGREESDREYRDPVLGPIFRAGFQNQHTKILTLAAELPRERLQGRVGALVAQAYRKVVIQRMKAGQHAAAAKRCLEMFERVPEYVEAVDKRRFNRVIKQLDKTGKKHEYEPVAVASPTSRPLFGVSDGSGWTLEDERKLVGAERPDTSFKIAAIGSEGSWLFARSKETSGQTDSGGTLRRLDRSGQMVAERAISHNVYRTGTGANGSNFAIMDSEGVLRLYDPALDLSQEINLSQDRRVREHFRTIDTNYWGDFRTQVRAVDVSLDGTQYLFTLADEAWCCTSAGKTVWGVSIPLPEGWKRVARRGDRFGVSREIDEALGVFGLSRPVNPLEIKTQYRALALVHHPDRNPENRDSPAVQGRLGHPTTARARR
jgi:hypothetical protein